MLWRQLLEEPMKLAAPLMRAVIGGLFVGHGTQKLFGWFDGPGLQGTSGMMERLQLRPPRRHAMLAGAAEAAGGAMLALGALTPLATMFLTSSMTTAIRKVHAPNGPWVTGGGWEYNAVLITAFAALAENGPGKPSVDSALFPRLHGTGWAIASLSAGVAGSYIADRPPLNEPAPEPEMDATGRFTRVEAEEPATVNN
jgi:putative oxidoreductase